MGARAGIVIAPTAAGDIEFRPKSYLTLGVEDCGAVTFALQFERTDDGPSLGLTRP